MFKVVTGDLFRSRADVLVHGANCCNKMASGVAGIVLKLYPEAVDVDRRTVSGDKTKLGNYSEWHGNHAYYKQPITVINAYTQFYPGPDARLEAIDRVFAKIAIDFKDNSISFPAIGSGIGGLRIEMVFELMQKHFNEHPKDVTLYLVDSDHIDKLKDHLK